MTRRDRRPLLLPAFLAACGGLAACGPNLTHPIPLDAQPAFTCVPDLDGEIDAAELVPVVGVPADYYVSASGTTPTVDLTGQVGSQGTRVWDFSALSPTDTRVAMAAAPITGKWYASSFPGGQFVVPSDTKDTLEGVYAYDDTALWLLGMASTSPSPAGGETLLVYQHPVALDRFPLAVGLSWTETGVISGGMLDGLPYSGQDVYQISVDAAGQVVLPDFVFTQALRIRVLLTQTPAVGGVSTTIRQVEFLSQCVGEIVRAVSLPNEPSPDFTKASQLRRRAG